MTTRTHRSADRNRRGGPPTVSVDQLEVHQYAGTAQLIDLGSRHERLALGWIAGSVHIPLDRLAEVADPDGPSVPASIDPTRTTILYCRGGKISGHGAQVLLDLGYRDVAHLDGGLRAWKRAGRPVVGLAPWHDVLRARLEASAMEVAS